jgi:hypothetical protein
MKQTNHKSCSSYWSHRSYYAIAMLALLLAVGATFSAQPSIRKLLPDGTVLDSLDGSLIADANGTWIFESSVDANSISGPVAAGTRLELLPSAILEILIADVNDRCTPTYRLSGQVTAYRGQNFFWPTYYLPLSKLKEAGPADTQGTSVTAPRKGMEPEIPPEVLAKLKERRAPRGPASPQSPQMQSPASLLVDVVGRIGIGPDGPVFTPDAYGWNISRTSYRLLPCGVLEQTLQRQAAAPEPLRFNVAGLITQFKDQKYLLLQRATRAYDYGDFGG